MREKRTDCPLLTLGPGPAGSGFVRRSRVFAGNVAECRTLGEIPASPGGDRNAVAVMDRGIADGASLAWLRENGYRWLVMSRERTRVFDGGGDPFHRHGPGDGTGACKETVEREEADGTPYREASLHCRSAARADRERKMMDQSIERLGWNRENFATVWQGPAHAGASPTPGAASDACGKGTPASPVTVT